MEVGRPCGSHLAHAVVCQLDVPFVVQQDVVQLQVAVDDALLMQEVESDADFSGVKSGGKQRRTTAFYELQKTFQSSWFFFFL